MYIMYSYTMLVYKQKCSIYNILAKTENLAEMCEYEKAVFSPETLLHYRGIA